MQNKLSVVHVIDILNAGGAERVLVTLSNIFHQQKHKVKVITTVRPGPLATQLLPGIEFQNLDRKWKWNPLTMYRLIRAVKSYDVIHVHSRHNLRYFLLAKSIFRLRKKVFYHEHHGFRSNTKASSIEKKLFSKTNFIAVSEALKHWAVNEACVNEAHVFVLPNIVLQQHVSSPLKSPEKISLVIVSNFVPVKNLEFAIEILLRLLKQSKKYHLTIIGGIADKEYHNKIVSLIANKGLNENITTIIDCTNVQSLLPQFDFAIHTSKSESGPLAVIEYMSQSLPFVVYRTGEAAEQVNENIPEFILENFQVDEWVFKITELLKFDQQILKEKIQSIFKKLYSAEAFYSQCLLIYKEGLKV